jgi:hypothetical protein
VAHQGSTSKVLTSSIETLYKKSESGRWQIIQPANF